MDSGGIWIEGETGIYGGLTAIWVFLVDKWRGRGLYLTGQQGWQRARRMGSVEKGTGGLSSP